jgi:hypothetical protein
LYSKWMMSSEMACASIIAKEGEGGVSVWRSPHSARAKRRPRRIRWEKRRGHREDAGGVRGGAKGPLPILGTPYARGGLVRIDRRDRESTVRRRGAGTCEKAGTPRRIPRPKPFLLLDRLHVRVALDLTDLRADLVLPEHPQLRQLCGDYLQGVKLAGPACLLVHLTLLLEVVVCP